jgi:hypothetical protein
MSWHYLRGGEGESLQDICLDGELCVPLKSKITHAEFYCNGKLMDSYLDSLFGTTFAHSMENLGKKKSMLSQVDFLAKTCQPQEKAQDLMASDQDFGGKWQGSFAKYNLDTHSLRTPQCLLFEDSTEFCAILPKWGLMRNGECWEVQMLGPFISETEFGLSLPTIVKSDINATSKNRFLNSPHFRGAKMSEGLRICETDPTSVHPSFGEKTMGWPTMWTGLAVLETAKFQEWQQQHGGF